MVKANLLPETPSKFYFETAEKAIDAIDFDAEKDDNLVLILLDLIKDKV